MAGTDDDPEFRLADKLAAFADGLDDQERALLAERLGWTSSPRPSRVGSSGEIVRPRLAERLHERFSVRLTVVCAGAGFGKSTLIHQVLNPVGAADRRVDVLVPVLLSDTPERVVDQALAELGAPPDGPRGPTRLAEVVWSMAPRQVCLVIDDLHRLTPAAADGLVNRLLVELPANGHLLVAGRRLPDVPMERLRLTGEMVELDETDLAFTDEEVNSFVAARGRSDAAMAATRWPALLELECRVGVANAERYLGEEILTLIPAERRHALAQLSVLRVLDDEMVRAVTGRAGSAAELVDGLPLVTTRPDGALVLHDIWLDVLGRQLSVDQRREASAAAARALRRRGSLEEAIAVSIRGDDEAGVKAVLRALVLDYTLESSVALLGRVLACVPETLAGSLEVRALAAGLQFANDQIRARTSLLEVLGEAQAAGDREIELMCVVRLAEIEFRCSAIDDLGRLVDHVAAIADEFPAAAVHALVGAWHALLRGEYAQASALLNDPIAMTFAPVSAAVLHYRRTWWAWVGESSRALSVVEEPVGAQHGRYVERGRIFTSLLRWHVGTLEHAERLVLGDALDRASTIGERHLVVEGAATVALFHLSAGDVSAATELMDLAQRSATGLEPGSWGLIALLQVRAVLAVMEGDESAAAELLRQTFPHEPPTRACAAHVHTNVIALGYALVPELAAIWDDVELGTDFAVGREVGRAITAVRSGVLQPAARLPWADLQRLRTWAFEPHLAELAVAAVAAGNRDAKVAIDALRSDPERHMMRLGRHPIDRVADEARTIAASISRRPGEMLEIGLLGPMTLRRDGVVVLDPALRRVRVRELLGVVAHHRRVSRRRIAELLWPDKDEPSAANNLRVTLNQLHRVLEPDRSARWRPWFVRTAGEDLVLEAGDTLIVDVDEFDRAIERGRTADRAGRASDALAAYLEGCEWYRGDYLGDAMAGEYAYLDQLRLRSDATSAATRASQLLLAQGRAIEARDLASRAVVLDPYLDAPHLVLAQAYRVDDRQDLARVVIERHLTMLRDNAMEPSAELLAELERP